MLPIVCVGIARAGQSHDDHQFFNDNIIPQHQKQI